MKLKVLADDKYQIVAVKDGETCPVEEFLTEGESSTEATRDGLFKMMLYVAEHGLGAMPSGWSSEANKSKRIYEFKRGSLRVFYFKGLGRQIAVCTSGVMKSGQKADKQAVNRAIAMREEYEKAAISNTIEVEDDETE